MARGLITAGDLARIYGTFNARYYGGTLPACRLALIPAGQRGLILEGRCWWGAYNQDPDGQGPLIELRETDVLVHRSYLHANLLHEMVHHRIGARHSHGSREWRAEVRRLSALGALRETL